MRLTRRAKEWGAEHFRGLQYPEPQWRSRPAAARGWTTEALRWMVLAWALWWIWGVFLLIVVCVAVALM